MRSKLPLTLEQLDVASFETQPQQQQPTGPAKDNPPTCLNTNCGPYLCCA
jgi:hypothetical protein